MTKLCKIQTGMVNSGASNIELRVKPQENMENTVWCYNSKQFAHLFLRKHFCESKKCPIF